MKAGLLPHLSSQVVTVYIEASPDATESSILKSLRRRLPDVPSDLSLKDTLATIRRGQGLPPDRKLLLIIDQFEQWLHAQPDVQERELVQALRQCDGGRVQCLIMVRDDFWLAVSRFLRDLEIALVEGQNSSLVDLFDLDHATRVLTAFGRAFGKLPDKPSQLDREHREFLKQAVEGLAQDGKVISVRLALFSEMMKSKEWTRAALNEVGTEGRAIGVRFLDETFTSSSAPPEHRHHQEAAKAVLKALLPEAGTDIKGHFRSRQELLLLAGYDKRPRDFDDVIRILDSELRLITPGEPGGLEDPSQSGNAMRNSSTN